MVVLNSNVGLYLYNLFVSVKNLFTDTDAALLNIAEASKNTNGLYYIITVIIEIINAFFASRFIIINAEAITTGKELVILKSFVYAAVVTTLLALYFCFDNTIFMTWMLIVVSAILLFISYSIYHSHFLRQYYSGRSRK